MQLKTTHLQKQKKQKKQTAPHSICPGRPFSDPSEKHFQWLFQDGRSLVTPQTSLSSPTLFSPQVSHSAVSDSLWPHGLQHSRLPCPSPTLKAYSNLHPSSQWCHPTISSSVVPFSSHLQSFSASESFPMSQFFASGGHSIGVSA